MPWVFSVSPVIQTEIHGYLNLVIRASSCNRDPLQIVKLDPITVADPIDLYELDG